MKKFTLLVIVAGLFLSIQSYAGKASLFTFNEGKIKSELAEVNALENYLLQNDNMTYTDLLAGNNPFARNLSFGNEGFMGFSSYEPPLGIPSFLWGFCFGGIGILIVYVITEEKEETMKALWGCVASGVIWTVLYFAVFAAAATST
ncbi:MAG: hypothetical protein K8S16_03705 [Bacteroidales bacterium]|nr:hypothetical protein [Bacteroidales bacterium]